VVAETMVIAEGDIYIWSGGSLLPGTYTAISYFFLAYTLFSFFLLLWYTCALQTNSTEDRLRLHGHLFLLVVVIVVESLVYTVLYFLWARDGVRPFGLKILCLLVSVLKRTSLRFILLTLR
jgi:hypothetical protein